MKQTLSSLSNRIEDLSAHLCVRTSKHLQCNDDGSIDFFGENGQYTYTPLPTTKDFHFSDSFRRLITGPVGSGKSSACCCEIIRRTCGMQPQRNGVRRSKWGIIRNTSGELETTTLETWLKWSSTFPKPVIHKLPRLNYKYQFNDGNGLIELELLFIPLDKIQDIGKLKSLELTGIWLNELVELPKMIYELACDRTRRYPDRDSVRNYWGGVIMDTNTDRDQDHWAYKQFVLNGNTENASAFIQPPGLIKIDGEWTHNDEAENLDHLADDYYTVLADGKEESYIKAFYCGKWLMTRAGKLVFESYSDDLHSVTDIVVYPSDTIDVGWDFGLTPCCLLGVERDGILYIIKEFFLERGGLRELATDVVLPYLQSNYRDHPINFSVIDPAGVAGSQTDGKSCLQVLNELGLFSRPARTNALVPRLDSVRQRLTRLVGARPALQIDSKECPKLRQAFLQKYCYKRLQVVGDEKFKDFPDKNHPWSDLMDTLQYICLEYSFASELKQVEIEPLPTRSAFA